MSYLEKIYPLQNCFFICFMAIYNLLFSYLNIWSLWIFIGAKYNIEIQLRYDTVTTVQALNHSFVFSELIWNSTIVKCTPYRLIVDFLLILCSTNLLWANTCISPLSFLNVHFTFLIKDKYSCTINEFLHLWDPWDSSQMIMVFSLTITFTWETDRLHVPYCYSCHCANWFHLNLWPQPLS